jgi:signal peptidase II
MRNGLRWLWVAVIVVILDMFSKHLALKHLIEYEPLPISKFFNLTLAYNRGAAFSFLGHAAGWQSWLFGILAIIVSIGILVWLKRLSKDQRWLSIALAMIIGGALGNLFDRICYGHVIDFIQWHVGSFYWPVFNLADSAICIGAFMLFFEAIFLRQK